MFARTQSTFVWIMATGLAFLGVLRALTIDNQLQVIKNDCYERLAIGQRHNPKDVYKTSQVTTVLECQLFCTKEKELCKSFSFGIGVKGNASCELSNDTIKETADLKPIGTKADTEFDLYIKKLGCTLVIDKNNPAFDQYSNNNKPQSTEYGQPQGGSYGTTPNKPSSGYDKPPPSPSYEKPTRPSSSGYDKPSSSGYDKPSTSGYDKPSSPNYNKPTYAVNEPPSSGYGYGSPNKPSYSKPQEETGHVETMVSISTGPQKPVLHPVHEILVGQGLYNYARPPFRPPALNHPYDRYDYDSRPGESNQVPYGHRPIPEKYGSYIPRPDNYYRPEPDDYYRPRPEHEYYRPRPNDDYGHRPGDYYRPNYRPRPPIDDYDRPTRPSSNYDRPRPPSGGYDRPDPPNNYDRPRPPTGGYDRPDPPSSNYDRPRPPIGGYDRPDPPSSNYDRPRPPIGGYDKPDPPITNYDRPRPPIGGYDRPEPPTGNYDRPRPPSSGYDRPNPPTSSYDRPKPPSGYDRPDPPTNNYDRPRPPSSNYDRPDPPNGNYERPKPPSSNYDRPNPSSTNNYDRPKPPSNTYDRPDPPTSNYDKPRPPSDSYVRPEPPSSNYDRPRPPSDSYVRPERPSSNYDRPNPPSSSYDRPSKPTNEYLFDKTIDRYDTQPEKGDNYQKPGTVKPTDGYDNSIKGNPKPKEPHSKPIVTHAIGSHGESITSIITELDEACFRRVLAGKRVTRALVKRALFCERVEDCQRECADEKRFPCEGFNYRLDPSGRGKGECELLEIPLSHLDIGRDLYPDPDYDYYERDRNAASANCKGGYYEQYGGNDGYYNRRHDQRPFDWWEEDRNRYGNRRPRPDFGYNRPDYGYDGYRPNGNRRGDFAYHHSHHSDPHNYHFEHYDHGLAPYDYKSYEPYLPPHRRPPYDEDRFYNKHYGNRDREKNYWGIAKPTWGTYGGSYGTSYNPHEFDRRNYYLPPQIGGSKDWGQYGGSYGNGGLNLQYNGYGHSQSFDFWGLNKYEEKFHNYGELPPNKPPSGGSYPPLKPPSNEGGNYLPVLPPKRPTSGSYLPENPPSYLPVLPPKSPNEGSYLPEKPSHGGSYLPEIPSKPPNGGSYLPELPGRYPINTGSYLPLPGKHDNDFYNSILPAEPRYPYRYDFLKDECSLRTAAGFRLQKGIVKKFYAVPNIYECELLCFKEKEFPCASYAFRYTVSLTSPTDNCYLSNRNYKELDYYTDLEPDRDFDVYTMNNMKKCDQPVIRGKEHSECFWRVRSAQRLDHKVVRDSLSVKSIVDCQLECLKSIGFTCRAFSYRYGSPVIGGPVDNCLLTDWPYYEMDPRIHFVPEPGFEIYERGSFGHGCEPHHFGIRGRPWKNPGMRLDQLCYSGYGSPSKLLPQACRKEIQVATEEECKAECSKYRDKTLFHCMSLSFSTRSSKWEPNCRLSDILQRDLLPNVDYIPDPDSWLFAWDNYNPECTATAHNPSHNHIGHKEDRNDFDDMSNAIGTWRVYSVSGWPCRRGSRCRENREAGFWFCELEGGDSNTWDYCCRPDHQCGFSHGFEYQWCYVGPSRTQWRKCSDRYYPYVHNLIDRFDRPPASAPWTPNNYLPDTRPPPYLPGGRPDRPPAPPTRPPPRPTLDEYEMQFESQFLDPPKPGGFGQPRHWPLSYLHKEMPPNSTDSDSRLMKAVQGRDSNPKFAAIQNLIDIIKSNDLKNVQYQITNESNKHDDILFVKIPLPTNFTQETRKSEKMVNATSVISGPIDLGNGGKNTTKRSQKALPVQERPVPVYRRGYITRTNVTNHRPRVSRTL
ncbi:uncharacterized protein LOC663405 [Tribolium castaneum]|uniref:uncharacterized protein LOC663405 n=1 Tax=Tribolium castaneum TaxID=7070 RepID=UPI0001DCBBA2|nr:PREDICTED: uncharacterized protein LOC663405 [Tribolium castaneum]|eukprot:XP_008195826.1 PREDICTED: uncharacterized protein LOC663405 [Tribolium castaneum]